jgi:hypothetical protein
MRNLIFFGLLAALAAGQQPAMAGPTDDSLDFHLLGVCAIPGYAVHVAVLGDIACIAASDSGLVVVNVSNPAAPVMVGRIATRPTATGIAIRGDYAYVTCRDSGLRIISIADPANPVQVGRHDTPYWALHVAVVDTLAYVGDFVAGLRIISVANPTSPYEVGFIHANRGACGVDVAGSHAYVADANKLSVIDVSNPAEPALVGSCLTEYARYVAVVDTLAYVADAQGGMRVVSVADPANPRTLTSYPAAYAAHVQATDDRVYLATTTRFAAFVPAQPGSPVPDGFYDMAAVASATAGDICYVTSGSDGLWVLKRGVAAVAERVPVRPAGPGLRLLANPAAGTVRIACPAGVTSVAAIDPAGRVVRTAAARDGRATFTDLVPGAYVLRPAGAITAPGVRLVVR